MRRITVIIDYKGNFGSKFNANPYRSGLDKKLLSNYFNNFNIPIDFIYYSDIQLSEKSLPDKIFIHDSTEDKGYRYKSYMEDIILALELKGALVIPGYHFIHAHNNKVSMELLRSIYLSDTDNKIISEHFGTLEEFQKRSLNFNYPVVIKGAEDAQGRQVLLGTNKYNTLKSIKHLNKNIHCFQLLKDQIRKYKHKGYLTESRYRKKFIIQNFIPNLTCDWKLLIFGDIIYILRRGIPKHDFKASGSKYNYGFGSKSTPPEGIFDFALRIFKTFNVPYASFDIAWDEKNFYLLEFQFVSFGSSTHLKSDCYYKKIDGEWKPHYKIVDLEYLYAYSIYSYLNNNSFTKH
jgi:glutathione synthase/RimK-type ligase-like ATP-grasp enzyme